MASNFKTVINFRDGIQVDTDDIVSTGGKVGIGSTIPRDTLDVRGNTIIDGGVEASSLDVSGVSTVAALDNTNLNVSGVGTVGGLKVESGIVTVVMGTLNVSSCPVKLLIFLLPMKKSPSLLRPV